MQEKYSDTVESDIIIYTQDVKKCTIENISRKKNVPFPPDCWGLL